MARPRHAWTDVDLADAVRDHLRLELIGIGHIAPRGSVHVTDHTVLAHTGAPSIFNRGTAVDLEQPDLAFAEITAFFDGLPHTLWLEADHLDDDTDRLLRGRGYVPMPDQQGVATTDFPVGLAHADRAQHADLISEPSDAAAVADVTATGLGLGVDDRLLFEDIARAILRHAKPWRHGAIYGVHRDGAVISVGSLLCTAHAAGLSGLATLPMHRHQGYSSSLAARALHDAEALGYDAAVSVSTPDSRKVFDRLGFRPVLSYRIYRQTRP